MWGRGKRAGIWLGFVQQIRRRAFSKGTSGSAKQPGKSVDSPRADCLLSLRETVNFFVPALLLYTTTLVTFPDSLTFALTLIHFGLSSLSTP